MLTAEKKFWRCVESREPPRLFGIEPPKPRIAAVRVVDMTGSNSWAEFATIFCNTRNAFLAHERAMLNFMLSVVKSIKPRDQIESMLATQMAGIHVATMRMMERLANADDTARLDSTERALNKLARTFAAQVEALKR
ncbi:MAG: hypothetical protein WCD75_13945 [Rhodoplanes sp.]